MRAGLPSPHFVVVPVHEMAGSAAAVMATYPVRAEAGRACRAAAA